MGEFFEKLKEGVENLRFKATGAAMGHVLSVEPKDQSDAAKRLFAEVMGLLGGGLVAASILVLRALSTASTSQVLGITSAKPLASGGASIGLFGYCLQARNKKPDSHEEYVLGEMEGLPEDRILGLLKQCDKNLEVFIDDYYFLEKLDNDGFKRKFRQCGVWILTDNVGFARVRDVLFPDFMFFTSGAMEILFWLRKCLQDSGENVKDFRFDGELISVFEINHELGFLNEENYKTLQDRFGFNIVEEPIDES